MLHIPEYNAAFIHIPKTAGQTIAHLLGRSHDPSAHSTGDYALYKDCFRFCFVRDPLDRFVSAHGYTVKVMKAKWMRDDLVNSQPVRRLAQEMGDDFDDLDLFVAEVERRGRAVLDGSLHFRRQTEWIRRGRPHFIGRTEALARDVVRLWELLGTAPPVAIPRRNADPRAGRPRSDHLRRFVRQVYEDDYRELGY